MALDPSVLNILAGITGTLRGQEQRRQLGMQEQARAREWARQDEQDAWQRRMNDATLAEHMFRLEQSKQAAQSLPDAVLRALQPPAVSAAPVRLPNIPLFPENPYAGAGPQAWMDGTLPVVPATPAPVAAAGPVDAAAAPFPPSVAAVLQANAAPDIGFFPNASVGAAPPTEPPIPQPLPIGTPRSLAEAQTESERLYPYLQVPMETLASLPSQQQLEVMDRAQKFNAVQDVNRQKYRDDWTRAQPKALPPELYVNDAGDISDVPTDGYAKMPANAAVAYSKIRQPKVLSPQQQSDAQAMWVSPDGKYVVESEQPGWWQTTRKGAPALQRSLASIASQQAMFGQNPQHMVGYVGPDGQFRLAQPQNASGSLPTATSGTGMKGAGSLPRLDNPFGNNPPPQYNFPPGTRPTTITNASTVIHQTKQEEAQKKGLALREEGNKLHEKALDLRQKLALATPDKIKAMQLRELSTFNTVARNMVDAKRRQLELAQNELKQVGLDTSISEAEVTRQQAAIRTSIATLKDQYQQATNQAELIKQRVLELGGMSQSVWNAGRDAIGKPQDAQWIASLIRFGHKENGALGAALQAYQNGIRIEDAHAAMQRVGLVLPKKIQEVIATLSPRQQRDAVDKARWWLFEEVRKAAKTANPTVVDLRDPVYNALYSKVQRYVHDVRKR